MVIVPDIPILADSFGFNNSIVVSRPYSGRVRLALHNLQAQPLRDVEGDVAVHQPRSGVVGPEGYNNVARTGQKHHISSWRIDQLWSPMIDIEFRVVCLFQESKVVTMQVDLTLFLACAGSNHDFLNLLGEHPGRCHSGLGTRDRSIAHMLDEAYRKTLETLTQSSLVPSSTAMLSRGSQSPLWSRCKNVGSE